MRELAWCFAITTLVLPALALPALALADDCPLIAAEIDGVELLSRDDPDALTAEISFRGVVEGGRDYCSVMLERGPNDLQPSREPRQVHQVVGRSRFVVPVGPPATFVLVCYHAVWRERANRRPATSRGAMDEAHDEAPDVEMSWCSDVVDRITIATKRPRRRELTVAAGERVCSIGGPRDESFDFLRVGQFEQSTSETCVSLPLWYRHSGRLRFRGGRATPRVLLEREHVVVHVRENQVARIAMVATAVVVALFFFVLFVVRRSSRRIGKVCFRDPSATGFRDNAQPQLRVTECPACVSELGGPFADSAVRLSVSARGVTFVGDDLVVMDPEGGLAYLASSSTVPFGSTLLLEGREVQLLAPRTQGEARQPPRISALDASRARAGLPNLLSVRRAAMSELVPLVTAATLAPFVPRMLFPVFRGAGYTAVAVPLTAVAAGAIFVLTCVAMQTVHDRAHARRLRMSSLKNSPA